MINEVREDPRNDLFCLMHWQTGSCHRHYLKMGMSKGIVPFSNIISEAYIFKKDALSLIKYR